MPWISEEECTSCGVCVDKCPVDAISINDVSAEIDMDGCIRCGVCHDVCPTDAVKHDSERFDEWVDDNMRRAIMSMDLCQELLGSEEEKWKCLDRLIGHFKREMRIASTTVEKLQKIRGE